MELIRGRQNIPSSAKPSVVSIGNFDGVHLGHLRLIEMLQREAQRADVPATVLTFDPHPHEFFNPTTCLLYTSPSPRDGLLSRMPSSA